MEVPALKKMHDPPADAFGKPLPRAFYDRETTRVARELLGRVLVHISSEGISAGRIVETEAYRQDDPASHSYQGQTPRNAPMFGAPGTAYLYLIYGIHWCFNAVTRAEGFGEAALIRALEPLEGTALMERRRNLTDPHRLCRGPGSLCAAMGLTGAFNGADLTQPGKVWIAEGDPVPDSQVVCTQRIGISRAVHYPWRYYVANCRYISRK
jgi:DNA-3-methyladenine glycosylase